MPVALLLAVLLLAWSPDAPGQTRAKPGAAGWEAVRASDYEAAERAFHTDLRSYPADPVLHLGLGVALHGQGRSDEARVPLAHALQLEPRLTPAAALLGHIVYAAGDLNGAIAVYERALTASPGAREMQEDLDRWRAEASLHAGFQQAGDGRFSVLFEGPEDRVLADRVHRVLEAAYWRIGGRLNAYPGETIPVILYTQQQFRDVTQSPSWAAGSYDGRIRMAVRGALQTPEALDRMVVHELAHAIVQHLAPRGVPAWLHEGLAVNFEGGDPAWVDATLARSGRLIPLEELERGFFGLDGPTAALAYAQSAAAAGVVINRLGPNLTAFLQSLGSVSSVDAALATFGFTTADVESSLRSRARGR